MLCDIIFKTFEKKTFVLQDPGLKKTEIYLLLCKYQEVFSFYI